MDRSALIARIVQPLLLATFGLACLGGSLPASRAAGEPAPQLLSAATGTHDLLATCAVTTSRWPCWMRPELTRWGLNSMLSTR